MGIENELPWERNFFLAAGMFPVELLAYQVWSVLEIGHDSFNYFVEIILC